MYISRPLYKYNEDSIDGYELFRHQLTLSNNVINFSF